MKNKKLSKNEIKRLIRAEKNALLKEGVHIKQGGSPALGVGFGAWQANARADFAKAYGREAYTVNDHRLIEQPISGEQAIQMQAAQERHWPRVDWNDISKLADKWADMEDRSFDVGDPSMTKDGELSQSEAKEWWNTQVENAMIDMESELTERIRKVALETMQEYSLMLDNGDFS
jgi:hypothetical protein